MRRMYSKKQLEEIAKDYIHEHEDVIANPQVTGTEPLLETIEIDGDKYILPQNAEITASEIDSEEATSGQVLMADGEGGASWGNIPNELPSSLGTAGQVLQVNSGGTGVEWGNVPNELPSVTGNADKLLKVNSGGTAVEWGYPNQLSYLTTAPTQDNTSGVLQIVVLSSEPATYYNGYYYIITGA